VHWYDSATFWTAAGVAVAFVTLVVIYRVAVPARTLIYGMPVVTPLLSDARADIKVLHEDKPLTSPHVVELHLGLNGRSDIRSADFDEGQPLVLDVGAHIVTVIESSSSPPSLSVPRAVAAGTALAVGPGLISRGQRLTFTLLADGADVRLSCRSHIADARLMRQGVVTLNSSLLRVRPVFWTCAAIMLLGNIAGDFALARNAIVTFVLITLITIAPFALLFAMMARAVVLARRESRA